MKFSRFLIFSAFLICSLSLNRCDFLVSKEEEAELRCTAFQLPSKEKGSLRITLSASRSVNRPDKDHNLLDAVQLDFYGAVTLIDCHSAAVNGSKIECSLNPSLLTAGKNSFVFWVSPPDYHEFIMTNSLESFLVRYYMIAHFADGKKFKSDIISASTGEVRTWNGNWDQTINSSLTEYTNWQ